MEMNMRCGKEYDYILSNEITLCDCNGTRIHNHLVRKRTLNHLAKLA